MKQGKRDVTEKHNEKEQVSRFDFLVSSETASLQVTGHRYAVPKYFLRRVKKISFFVQ